MSKTAHSITWLGHSTFLIESAGGKRILIDPWIANNPAFPEGWKEKLQPLDLILISHGHFDHCTDVIQVAQETKAQVGCIFEIALWLGGKGFSSEAVTGFNKGGTASLAGLRITMTDARHSSGLVEDGQIIYLGEACGFIIELEDGFKVYYTGDTAVFGDMQLIGDLYHPDLVILPIGDFYTMGPEQAAYALKLIGAPRAIPGHFATFPILNGTPAQVRQHVLARGASTEVIELSPGESWRSSSA